MEQSNMEKLRATWKKQTAQKLDQYRAFRHVFRNVYDFSLDPYRLKILLNNFLATVALLRRDLQDFQEKIKPTFDSLT